MIPNSHELREFCCLYDCAWTPNRMNRAYEIIVQSWTQAGFPPDKLALQAPDTPGIGDKWGSFKQKRRQLEHTKFEGIISFSLSHLAEAGGYSAELMHPDRDWLAYATATVRRQECVLGWIPSIIGKSTHDFHEIFREVASLSRASYGYRFHRRYNLQVMWDLPPESPTQKEASANSTAWRFDRTEQAGRLLLRDIFVHNYLSDSHLEAPFGMTGMTLRQWIQDDPVERGELKWFTDILTEWTPPPTNIPFMREALFRAGRLFYHCFFDDRNPCFRLNIHEPWEVSGPIPEIFRAECYVEVFENTC